MSRRSNVCAWHEFLLPLLLPFIWTTCWAPFASTISIRSSGIQPAGYLLTRLAEALTNSCVRSPPLLHYALLLVQHSPQCTRPRPPRCHHLGSRPPPRPHAGSPPGTPATAPSRVSGSPAFGRRGRGCGNGSHTQWHHPCIKVRCTAVVVGKLHSSRAWPFAIIEICLLGIPPRVYEGDYEH